MDLLVWQKSHALVLNVYKLTRSFPKCEEFCLIPQMRRASISVPANIAEGFKRRGKADKTKFLNIAQGSLEELRHYLILSQDLGYCNTDGLTQQLEKICRMLGAYAFSIKPLQWD